MVNKIYVMVNKIHVMVRLPHIFFVAVINTDFFFKVNFFNKNHDHVKEITGTGKIKWHSLTILLLQNKGIGN